MRPRTIPVMIINPRLMFGTEVINNIPTKITIIDVIL